jgi:HSP20 family molecular chaperone IbpA
MAIERWRPFGALMEREPFREIQSEMNRLFDNFFGRPTTTVPGTGSRVWMPIVDMYETNDDLILDVELPGVREKEISLTINWRGAHGEGRPPIRRAAEGRQLRSHGARLREVRALDPTANAGAGGASDGHLP